MRIQSLSILTGIFATSLTLGACASDNSVADTAVRRAVDRALILDRETDWYQIDTKVSKGVVSLNGRVDSEYEKSQALTIAKRAPDVRDVKDGLVVSKDASQPRFVSTPTAAPPTLASSPVQLPTAMPNEPKRVEPARVAAAPEPEKKSETKKASTPPPFTAQPSAPAPAPSTPPPFTAQPGTAQPGTAQPPTNAPAPVVAAVAAATPGAAGGPSSFETQIDSSGTATLRGTVANEDEKRVASEAVARVAGVRFVDNQLRVQGTAPTDDAIAQATRAALPAGATIAVAVTAGRAQLSGTVGTWGDYFLATRAALIAGAKAVQNSLRVNEALTAEATTRLATEVQAE